LSDKFIFLARFPFQCEIFYIPLIFNRFLLAGTGQKYFYLEYLRRQHTGLQASPVIGHEATRDDPGRYRRSFCRRVSKSERGGLCRHAAPRKEREKHPVIVKKWLFLVASLWVISDNEI